MWRKTIFLDENPKVIKIFDKRLTPPFIVAKPDDKDIEWLVQDADDIILDNGVEIEYLTPNIVSLQLSIARKSMDDAKVILAEIYKLQSKNC